MQVRVSSYNWARRHKRDFDAVVSIEDPDAKRRLRFTKKPHPPHLVLTFVDLDRPAPAPYTDWAVFRLAEREHLERVLAFAEDKEKVLVHCQAGVGRSAAIGLTLLANDDGPGQEEESLRRLLEVRPESVPNLHIMALADELLGRGGKLLEVVQTWDAGRPANLRRRTLNRKSHFLYYGLKVEE